MLVLATEILKVKNRILPELSIFQFPNKLYNSRNACILCSKKIKTAYNSDENLFSLSPKIWELILNSLKEETSLAVFKNKTQHVGNKLMPVGNIEKELDSLNVPEIYFHTFVLFIFLNIFFGFNIV